MEYKDSLNMQRSIEQIESPSLKRASQVARAPSRTRSQWFMEAEHKKRHEDLARAGKAIGSNGKLRDMVLHMHERRMQDFENQRVAAENDSSEKLRIGNEEMEYMLKCGGIVATFASAGEDNNLRRELTIKYLNEIDDVIGANTVVDQWFKTRKARDGEDDEIDDEDENWPQKLIASAGAFVDDSEEVCKGCGSTDIVEDKSEFVCTACGMASTVNMSSSGMNRTVNNGGGCGSGGGMTGGAVKYSYNRASHFRDRILQWLGCEFRGDVSQDVIDKLLLQLRKERVTSVDNWSKKRMVSLLKRAGLNEYYEHSHHFISQLSGKPVPFELDRETIEVLMQMFQRFEVAYEKHKHLLCDARHTRRKNIITISYVLRKFFLILGLPEYAESFTMLKNVDKISAYEVVFKHCCEDLNWPFIPSL